MKLIYITVLFILLIAGASYAACPEPDVSKEYSACTSKCPDAVTHTFAYADCINDCLAMWTKMQEDHARCTKAENEAEEKKRIERENKLRGIEEAKITTVSTVEGMIWLTNPEGLASKLSNSELLDMKPGSILRSDPDSTAAVTIREGSRLQLGPDSQFTYIDGEPIIEGEPEKMKYTYEVSKGRVRFESEDSNTQYEVHTSQGTVVNRETDFIVEVDPDANMTSIYLYEGMLDVNTTAGEWLVLNPGEMINIDSASFTKVLNLSIEDWNGLVNSTETGANFTPSWKRMAEKKSYTDIFRSEKNQNILFITLFIIIMAVAITVGSAMRARRKIKKKS